MLLGLGKFKFVYCVSDNLLLIGCHGNRRSLVYVNETKPQIFFFFFFSSAVYPSSIFIPGTSYNN